MTTPSDTLLAQPARCLPVARPHDKPSAHRNEVLHRFARAPVTRRDDAAMARGVAAGGITHTG